MRKRTLSREWVLKILYQCDLTGKKISHIARETSLNKAPKDPQMIEFAERILLGIEENLQRIDQKISQYATNWQINRMAVIDRNILRIGVFELMFSSDVPPKVVINEAVELAKKYGDLESSKFVNGVLDKIHKEEIISQKQ